MIIDKHVDAVIGLQYGDEGKGKVTASIAEQYEYDLNARYNGGPNAGHSIHKQNGAHYELHQIPSAVAFEQLAYIGPGCVIDLPKLKKEIEDFKKVEGINPLDYLTISKKVPLITSEHKNIDTKYHALHQGSTSSGIAPAYSDFYNRKCTLVTQDQIEHHLDSWNLLYDHKHVEDLLLEGAQGFYLDPHNNYPYVTSSFSHPGYAAANFPFTSNKFRHIIGVAKCYETRSGIDPNFMNQFEGGEFLNAAIPFSTQDFEDFKKIQNYAKEVGVTTGRKRQVRYLCVERLIHAIQSTGTTIVVINKWDILDELNIHYFVLKNKIFKFNNSIDMFLSLKNILKTHCTNIEVIYSASPFNDIDWSAYLE